MPRIVDRKRTLFVTLIAIFLVNCGPSKLAQTVPTEDEDTSSTTDSVQDKNDQNASDTNDSDLAFPAHCGTIEEGLACLELRFGVELDLYRESDKPITGDIYWALYRDEDVRILIGPQGSTPVTRGGPLAVAYAQPTSQYAVTVSNLATGVYEALAFIDEEGTDPDDPQEHSDALATTPAELDFEVLADKYSVHEVEFDGRVP